MKLLKKIWEMSGTPKGSCQILCTLITAITIYNVVLDLVPPNYSGAMLGLNAALWFGVILMEDE